MQYNEAQLKNKLQHLAENKYCYPENEDVDTLIQAMLNHIGTTDAVLRDDLIYTAFGTWIWDYHALSQTQLHNLWQEALSENHIFYQIGSQNSDAVFRRSFSALLLPLILIEHRAKPFLTVLEINETKAKLTRFFSQEKDRRGFVAGKGWAHAIAHAADALDDLAQCVELDGSDLLDLLVVIRDTICVVEVGYLHGEEERLITAVLAILQRQLISEADVMQWLRSFADKVLPVKKMPDGYIIRINVKNFLQSLHFRLKWAKIGAEYVPAIDQTLHKISMFIKHDTE